MPTVRQSRDPVRVGDDVVWEFPITDEKGAPVTDGAGNVIDFSTATGTYRISDGLGNAHFLELTQGSGIVFGPQMATVAFNTSNVKKNTAQVTGDVYDQLRVTVNGRSLVISEGLFNIIGLIS